jgi:hypothetical protein
MFDTSNDQSAGTNAQHGPDPSRDVCQPNGAGRPNTASPHRGAGGQATEPRGRSGEHACDQPPEPHADRSDHLEGRATPHPARLVQPRSGAQVVAAAAERLSAGLLDRLDRLSPRELADHIELIERAEEVLRGALTALVGEFSRREAHRGDGARSVPAWLTQRLGIAYKHAVGLSRVAETVRELPALRQAQLDGAVTFDKLSVLTRVATPANDEALAQEAPNRSVRELELLARTAEAPTADEVRRAYEARHCLLSFTRTQLKLRASLPADDGAIVAKALYQIADSLPTQPAANAEVPEAARLADALVELARGQEEPTSGSSRPRPLVVIHVRDHPPSAVIQQGPALADSTIERIICDARCQVVRENANGEAIGLGRTTRTVPAWLFRQLLERDGGCRFPGCGLSRHVEGHHVVSWVRGGHTDPANLILLCSFHHRVVHEHGWAVRGDPNNELRFAPPRGSRSGDRALVSRPASSLRNVVVRPDERPP